MVREVGLVDKVFYLENRARAKPLHYFLRQETFLCNSFSQPFIPLENSTTKVACHPGDAALRVTKIAKSDQTEDV